MKRIAILGSTGSIGQSALAVVDAHRRSPAGRRRSRPARTPSCSPSRSRATGRASRRWRRGAALDRLRRDGSAARTSTIAGAGRDGLVAVASHPDVDIVLCASSRHRRRSRRCSRRSSAARRSRSPTRKCSSWPAALVTDAARAPRRRDPAGRQRAQRDSPVPARPAPRRGEAADPDRVGRTVPRPAGVRPGAASPPTTRCSIRRGRWAGRSRSTRRR